MDGRAARCAVVGAANIDIGGFPAGRLVPGDSNPGRVTLSAGGVGRNIACNLERLGVETHLVAALGDDAFAEIARADCARAGVDTGLCLSFKGAASSAYLFIAEPDGDMHLAVNDMGICERLTPQALAERIDANLPAEALDYLARNIRVPLLADAVSAAKAPRLTGALDRLWAVKPNALEAEALTGMPVTDADSAARAARRLIDMGAARCFITLGSQGVCCADARQVLCLPGQPVRLRNATGAGDAFTAALAWGALRGLDLRSCAAAGLAASCVAVESLQTVSDAISAAAVWARAERILSEE